VVVVIAASIARVTLSPYRDESTDAEVGATVMTDDADGDILQ